MNQVSFFFSLNARGLREYIKRSNLFYWLREKQFNIIFLQETYWTNNMITKIEKEWERKGNLY